MIFLIHGKNSNRNSITLNAFLKVKKKKKYTFIEYDWTQPFEVVEQQIKDQLLNITEEDILVGHSLGGYWVLLFSLIFNTRAILINPSLKPISTEYPFIPTRVKTNRAGLCLTSSKDEVLPDNYNVCKNILPNLEVIDTKFSHRVTDFSKYQKEINELLGEYLW